MNPLSLSDFPLISIITPCLNRAEFVAEAIESVLSQDYPNVEHIIMDGGSTDGTLEVLSRYPHLRVVSEPDKGLYDAINKGIGISRGVLIGVLNTDDYYERNIFYEIVNEFMNRPNVEAVSGGSRIFTVDHAGKKNVVIENSCIYKDDMMRCATIHESSFNAWFFCRNLFDQVGWFDLNYHYLADRDFLIRLALMKFNFASLNRVVYYYRQHPESLTFRGRYDMEGELGQEARQIAENYLARPDIEPENRKILTEWHSHILIEQSFSSIRRYSMRIFRYALLGMHYDPLWMLKFGRRFFVLLGKRVLALANEK